LHIQVAKRGKAKSGHELINGDRVEVANANLASSDALAADSGRDILSVLRIFEVIGIDSGFVPLSLIVVLHSCADLVTTTLFDVFFAFGPLKHFDVAIHNRMAARHDAKLRICDRPIY